MEKSKIPKHIYTAGLTLTSALFLFLYLTNKGPAFYFIILNSHLVIISKFLGCAFHRISQTTTAEAVLCTY